MSCSLRQFLWGVLLINLLVDHSIETTRENNKNIKAIFEEDKIVGDVLDMAPLSKLLVKFGEIPLYPGQELTVNQTQMQPSLVRWKSKKDTYYTLLSLDPDALSREKPDYRSVVHWMFTNIPSEGKNKGDNIILYFGPSPPNGTGLHRYIFLVFEQIGGTINVTNLEYTEYLGNQYVFKFSARDFIDLYILSKAPVAGNYFQTQYTEK